MEGKDPNYARLSNPEEHVQMPQQPILLIRDDGDESFKSENAIKN